MKIYKKILNFGYGICCLLPILMLIFACLFRVKNGETITLPIEQSGSELEALGQNFYSILNGTSKWFVYDVEWFEPFKIFNNFIADNFYGYGSIGEAMSHDSCWLSSFVLLYSEWVVLVSFFRLFGSVFGCMINFADRMLDKIGGTN